MATSCRGLVRAAQDRPVVEFGFRRAHGIDTAIEASLAAYVGGCVSTSNVAAGQRHGVPISGTMAHSFVQAFDFEESGAFPWVHLHDHQGSTLLIDTYHRTLSGIDRAMALAKAGASFRRGAHRLGAADRAVA